MSEVHQAGQPEGEGLKEPPADAEVRLSTEPVIVQGADPASEEADHEGKRVMVKYHGPSGTFVIPEHGTLTVGGDAVELDGEIYDSLVKHFPDHNFELVRTRRSGGDRGGRKGHGKGGGGKS